MSAKHIWAKRAANALLLALCLLPVLSFAWLGPYSRTTRDEFRFTPIYADMTAWEGFVWGLNHDYTSAYARVAVRALLAPLGYSAPAVFPAIILVAQFVSISWLLYHALNAVGLQSNRRLTAAAVGGVLLSAVCASLPTPQVLYSYEHALKYSLSIVPAVLYMLVLLHVASQSTIRKRRLWIWALIGWALCFVAAGYSETFFLVMLLGLGLLLCLALAAGGEWRRRTLPILASGISATVAGIVLIMASPGFQNRAARRWLRSSLSARSPDEVLAQTMEAWLDRIGDPAYLAGIALMLAVGVLVGMQLPKTNRNGREQTQQPSRLPLFLALASQLLLALLIWPHQSDQPVIFGRFSASYFYVIAMNTLLILGAALLLWQQRRGAIRRLTAAKAAAYAGLAGILLCFAPTQLRDMHWRAYMYLWLSAHILLIILGWHMSRWLRADHAKAFAVGLGGLYVLILAGAAVVSVPVNIWSVGDIARPYTFLAHLIAWLGLAWGVTLGWAFRSMINSRRWLAAGALLVVVGLSAPVVADNWQMLPLWRQHAAEFDERLAIILAGQAKGQRHYVFAPFSFDWAKYLGVASMHNDPFLLEDYGIDSITLAET